MIIGYTTGTEGQDKNKGLKFKIGKFVLKVLKFPSAFHICMPKNSIGLMRTMN